MSKSENRLMFKYAYLQASFVILLLLSSLFLLWHGNTTSNQESLVMIAQAYFDGGYRIAEDPWQEIAEGEHIPETKSDVTLRGNFHALTPNGEYIGIYARNQASAAENIGFYRPQSLLQRIPLRRVSGDSAAVIKQTRG